ncbi:MAG: hypothetical protein CGEMS_1591 [Candidatus Campylobacter infans]|nr:MAG: hypothetical protein CGEMS_1591 [Candidatus Campylobacter infans]
MALLGFWQIFSKNSLLDFKILISFLFFYFKFCAGFLKFSLFFCSFFMRGFIF